MSFQRKTLSLNVDRTKGEEVRLGGTTLAVVTASSDTSLEVSFDGQAGARIPAAFVRAVRMVNGFSSVWVFHQQSALGTVDLLAGDNDTSFLVPQPGQNTGVSTSAQRTLVSRLLTGIGVTGMVTAPGANVRVRIYGYRYSCTTDASPAFSLALSDIGGTILSQFDAENFANGAAAGAGTAGQRGTGWIDLGTGVVIPTNTGVGAKLSANLLSGAAYAQVLYSLEGV